MLEEKKISKFLSDASLSKICSVLKSKAEYYGKRYIQIDTTIQVVRNVVDASIKMKK